MSGLNKRPPTPVEVTGAGYGNRLIMSRLIITDCYDAAGPVEQHISLLVINETNQNVFLLRRQIIFKENEPK